MATAAVDDILFGYKIDPNSMGKVVIVNNEKFTAKSQLLKRSGSERDVQRLRGLFLKIGYKDEDIHIHRNRTVSELQRMFKDVSKNLVNPKHSTFVLCLMSHGFKNNKIYDINGDFLHLWHDILTEFCDKNCQNLVGIPKLVITQFCQGESKLAPMVMSPDDDAPAEDETTIPEWADLLLFKASPPYHVSLRNSKTGSIFIQSFCEVCQQYYTQLSITDIMTIVVNKVASMENLYLPDENKAKKKTKSLPGTAWNSLRKKFYLFDKRGRSDLGFPDSQTVDLQDEMDSLIVLKSDQFIDSVRSDTHKLTSAATVIGNSWDRNKFTLQMWNLNDKDRSWRHYDLVVNHTLDLEQSPEAAAIITILDNMLLIQMVVDDKFRTQILSVDSSSGHVLHKSQVYASRGLPDYCCCKSQVLLPDADSSSITQLDPETFDILNTWTDKRVGNPCRIRSNKTRAAVYDWDKSILVFTWENVQLSRDMIYTVEYKDVCYGIHLLPDNTLVALNNSDQWSVWSESGAPVHITVQHPAVLPGAKVSSCVQDPVSGDVFAQEYSELDDDADIKLIYSMRTVMERLENQDKSKICKSQLKLNKTVKFS